jgi:N-acyl homoserine lactone hydrolase
VTALEQVGVDERDVVAVINSHLHFDHCGQNEVFHHRGVPIYTHAAEIEVAQTFGYTAPEWAAIPDDLVRLVRGDEQVADGVRIIETPGHTPGHMSVVVETADGPVVIAGQCVYKTDEMVEQPVAADNMHDDTFLDVGQQSLERLLALTPCEVVVAHDVRSWMPTEPTP